MKRADITAKMIEFYRGDLLAVNHFLKVHAFAAAIGVLEGLDAQTQDILETAAIVHDIACPLCREKYGDASGKHQEQESEALLGPFLEEFALPEHIFNRVVTLVTHHHTYTDVDGLDYQILLEADYLVNAGESGKSAEDIRKFRSQVFRTQAGKRLLDAIYLP